MKEKKDWNPLTSDEERIIVRKGTEYPFTGQYNKWNEQGVFVCRRCEAPLYKSSDKFDSGCGWPSFDQAIKGSVIYKEDLSFGMVRTEVMCAKCGGHLGHVFDDGPRETTGKRYCTNSVSIKFVPEK